MVIRAPLLLEETPPQSGTPAWKGGTRSCPDFSTGWFHFQFQTTGHQMGLTCWKIMFYGRVVKNKMEALALLSNSNLLDLSAPKGLDFPPSWKLLVLSKGIPLAGQTCPTCELLGYEEVDLSLRWFPNFSSLWQSIKEIQPLIKMHTNLFGNCTK